MFGQSKEHQQSQPDFEYFAIYDSKSGSYFNPIAVPNRLVAIRDLENLFTDPKEQRNSIVINAEDYSLFKIGCYYKKTGNIIGQNPEHIVNLHEVKSLALRNAIPQERPVVQNTQIPGH